MKTWILKHNDDFEALALDIAECLLRAPAVDSRSWQSQDVTNDPNMITFELRHAHMSIGVPRRDSELAKMTGANLPWAEDHFQERVGGEPLNPPPSEAWWPYAQAGNAAHKANTKFSHTYPERFWPKFAGYSKGLVGYAEPHRGVRYNYGDLNDVIELMRRDPLTRQAYLPVWFPEDTGSVGGQRVPCTLGYQFLTREGRTDIEYHIRSCDYMRHWRDDVYMAGRLLQWVCSRIETKPGRLVMNIGSFHIFAGDRTHLSQWVGRTKTQLSRDQHARITSAL